jgi:8-oxo-dGTP pyrophosphatase MutT (NUDIX family)
LTPSTIPEFGTRSPGITYRPRPGGYLILSDNAGEIAVVEELGGWFLPGGGQDGAETPEAAATREAYEECSFRVVIERSIGVADEYVFSQVESAHLHKRCSFFLGRITQRDSQRVPELPVVWLPPRRAVTQLSHGSQRWAVARTFGL